MQPETAPHPDSTSQVLTGISILILIYIVACFFGGPQHATQMVVKQETDHEADHGFAPLHTTDHSGPHGDQHADHQMHHAATEHDQSAAAARGS